MGTINRTGKKTKKAAKQAKKVVKKKPAPVLAATDTPDFAAQLDSVGSEVETILDALTRHVAGLMPDDELPQTVMGSALVITRLKQALEATEEALNTAVLTHVHAGGVHEIGPVQLAIKTTAGRRSPQWKVEATEQARKHDALMHGIDTTLEVEQKADVLHAAMEFQFNEKAYLAAIAERTPKSPDSEKPKFSLSA